MKFATLFLLFLVLTGQVGARKGPRVPIGSRAEPPPQNSHTTNRKLQNNLGNDSLNKIGKKTKKGANGLYDALMGSTSGKVATGIIGGAIATAAAGILADSMSKKAKLAGKIVGGALSTAGKLGGLFGKGKSGLPLQPAAGGSAFNNNRSRGSFSDGDESTGSCVTRSNAGPPGRAHTPPRRSPRMSRQKGITVDAPVAPMAILPPKPVLVAPLIIRPKRRTRKIKILRSGLYPGNEAQVPYPAHYPASFPLFRKMQQQPPYPIMPSPDIPNRSLYSGQQINFESVSQNVPDLFTSLKISNVPKVLLPTTQAELSTNEDQAIQKVKQMTIATNELQSISDAAHSLRLSMNGAWSELRKGNLELDTGISKVLAVKNQATALGIIVI